MAKATITNASHPKMAVLRWAALQRPMRAARLRDCLSGDMWFSLVRVARGFRGGLRLRTEPLRGPPGAAAGSPVDRGAVFWWPGGRPPRRRAPDAPEPRGGGAPGGGASLRRAVSLCLRRRGARRPASIRAVPAPASATPARSMPTPSHSTMSVATATRVVARTPAEPSAFITTADQSPFWTGQTTV